MLSSDLAASLPTSVQRVPVQGDSVPRFDTPIPRSEGLAPVTIDPPLDEYGRGVYVSNVCAPMASKKSFHSRLHAWSKKSITVVLAVRVSYALNAAQEWRESAPNATEQDAAAREALALQRKPQPQLLVLADSSTLNAFTTDKISAASITADETNLANTNANTNA